MDRLCPIGRPPARSRIPEGQPLTPDERARARWAHAHGYTREGLCRAFRMPLSAINEALGEEDCERCEATERNLRTANARLILAVALAAYFFGWVMWGLR